MARITGALESKLKPLAPIHTYEVDLGKGKPILIQANRVDQIGGAIAFSIEYTDYNVYVAGFASWASYKIVDPSEKAEQPPVKEKKVKSQPQFQFSL